METILMLAFRRVSKHWRFVLVFSLLLLLSAHSPRKVGVLEICVDQDSAMVFVDARLFGLANRANPLVCRLHAGRHELRVSVQGHPDLFGAVDVLAGKSITINSTQPTTKKSAPPVNFKPLVQLGQTLRLHLPPLQQTTATSKPNPAIYQFLLPGKTNERVMVVLADGTAPIMKVHAADGEELVLRRLAPNDCVGLDGIFFGEFTQKNDQPVTLSVVNPHQESSTCVLRICRGAAPIVTNGRFQDRRQPPSEWRH